MTPIRQTAEQLASELIERYEGALAHPASDPPVPSDDDRRERLFAHLSDAIEDALITERMHVLAFLGHSCQEAMRELIRARRTEQEQS